jgi:trk system potassium uptake protein TrkA
MGVKIARSLLRKNITDLIEIDESYCIVEMKVPINWTGKSLIKLNLRKKYNINIIGIRNNETKQIEFTVDPEHVVSMDDHFLIVGNTAVIESMDFKIKE